MKRSIFKETFKLYFKHFFSYLSLSILYTSLILIGFIGVYFFFPSIILVMILLFTPASFALHYSVNLIHNNEPFSFKMFFKGFGLYFSNLFRGGYSSIRNLLFSILVFFLMAIVIFMPFEFYEIFTNKDLYNLITSTEEISYETLYNIILSNETIMLGFNISFIVSGFITSILYLHFHLKRSLAISNQLFSQYPQPMPMVKHFSKYQYRLFRKTFYKDYFKLIWLPLLVYILGYALGVFLEYRFLFVEADKLMALGFIVGLVFLIPIYPLIAIFINNIVIFNERDFKLTYAKSVIYNLSRFPLESLPKDEQIVITNMIKAAEEIIKALDKKE